MSAQLLSSQPSGGARNSSDASGIVPPASSIPEAMFRNWPGLIVAGGVQPIGHPLATPIGFDWYRLPSPVSSRSKLSQSLSRRSEFPGPEVWKSVAGKL